MSSSYKIIGISGALRKASTNTGALRAAVSLAPKRMNFEIANISQIPLYDGDVEAQGIPDSVK